MNNAMNLLFSVLLCFIAANSISGAPATVAVPQTGTFSERVDALWDFTRNSMSTDASASLSDQQWVERGRPLVAAWDALEKEIGSDADSTPINSITRLIEDFYGRPHSSPERRSEIRKWARSEYGTRVQQIESRMD